MPEKLYSLYNCFANLINFYLNIRIRIEFSVFRINMGNFVIFSL